MSAPLFTPGPWQNMHDFSKKGFCTVLANVDGDTHADGYTTYSYDLICTCEDEYGEYTERAEANARLIKHAPDLYSNLGRISARVLEYIGESPEDDLECDEELRVLANEGLSLLASVRGEQFRHALAQQLAASSKTGGQS